MTGPASGQVRARVPDGLAGRLREQARRHGVSLATVFHVIWSRALAAVSGRDDVVVRHGAVRADAGRGRLGPGAGPVRQHAAGIRAHRGGRGAGRGPGHAGSAGRADGARARLPRAGPAGQRRSRARPAVHRLVQLPAHRQPRTAQRSRYGSGRWCGWAGAEQVGDWEATNYPLVVSVDDLAACITFEVQAVAPVDGAAVAQMLQAAASGVVGALESGPQAPGPGASAGQRRARADRLQLERHRACGARGDGAGAVRRAGSGHAGRGRGGVPTG